MLTIGEKVFIITRRLFDLDLRRHFIGEVQAVSAATTRIQGYVYVFDDFSKEFKRRDDLRVRVFSLIDAGVVVNVLPSDAIIEEIKYIWDNTQIYITDGKTFKMNITEFGGRG